MDRDSSQQIESDPFDSVSRGRDTRSKSCALCLCAVALAVCARCRYGVGPHLVHTREKTHSLVFLSRDRRTGHTESCAIPTCLRTWSQLNRSNEKSCYRPSFTPGPRSRGVPHSACGVISIPPSPSCSRLACCRSLLRVAAIHRGSGTPTDGVDAAGLIGALLKRALLAARGRRRVGQATLAASSVAALDHVFEALREGDDGRVLDAERVL